jgi:site-specific DNA recombinase
VVAVYPDEAWSGAALARPALDRLRDDARKKLFDAVLINDVDRLARDVTHLGIIKRDLEQSGVQVIFRKIPSENSPTHNLLVNILGSFAEFEREMILDRTRRGRRHKAETRQQFIGALAPYGYRYIPATANNPSGRLLVNPEEAVIVRKIYDWVDREGLTAREVAARLTREGIRPRKGGPIWQRSSTLHVLRGTIYDGIWHYNKHQLSFRRTLLPGAEPQGKKTSLRLRPREEWIPVSLPDALRIVSHEQWLRVQAQLDRNRCFSPRNAKHEYLLSALVRCGGCQGPYCGSPSHGRFHYRCWRRCKRMPQIAESMLDDSVWLAMEEALSNPRILKDAIQKIDWRQSADNRAETQVQAALDGIKNEETRIFEAYRLNVLTPEQLARELEQLAVRRKVLEKQQCEFVQPKRTNRSVQMTVEEYCREIRRRLVNLTFETKRNVLRLLLRRIVFEGDQVRISGVIPLAASGGIANTGIESCGPNAALSASFTLTAAVHRDHTAAHAASRANLTRANAALRAQRQARHAA